MNMWKKKVVTGTALMLIGGLGLFSSANADSGAPSLEELMGEGIIQPSYSEKSITYRGDNSIPSTDEMLTEGISAPQSDVKEKYVYDAYVPSVGNWMAEGMYSGSSADPATENNTLQISMY